MNEYDSDKMADVLRVDQGMEQTEVPEEADIILFNTCSVREKAQEKVFSDLGRVRPLKLAKPDLLIGVGGCVASQEGKHIVQRAPYVDMVFGPQTLHRLPQMIAARRASGRSQVDISFPEIEKFDHLPAPITSSGSAYVSIMEGCSKYCSFCVVPYTRGEEVSRPYVDVLREVRALVAQGVAEITLLGQNVNAYSGAMEDGDCVDLAFLLQALATLEGLQRLRFTTSHPREMSQRLIDVYASTPKLASHLHLPVQSGSDRILAAMKRGYTALEYKSTVRKLRAARPDTTLTSDFIVGFPGETERDFESTMNLIEEVGFDAGFSFLYSPRPGTPAASLVDEVPVEVKAERLQRLQSFLTTQSVQQAQNWLGSVQRVLIEGASRKDTLEWAGRMDNNRIVNFPNVKLPGVKLPGVKLPGGEVMGQEMSGRFVNVKITAVSAYTLRGEQVH